MNLLDSSVHNRRIRGVQALVAPGALRRELPLGAPAERLVAAARHAAANIVHGRDRRVLVVVGPCSIHDPEAAFDYARRLAEMARRYRDDLVVIMRAYFEKPRTTLGWKGLINDPELDGTFHVNEGLRTARHVIVNIIGLGLPVGCEFLDPITPQYLADGVSWGSIGARTAQSQIHRQLASGLSMPIGIKNSPDGDIQSAVDAVAAAGASHVFPGIDDDGRAALFTTTGNADCHVVLRGGAASPNYSEEHIADATGRLAAAGLPGLLVIDASHGNSGKDHRRQAQVASAIAARIGDGEGAIAGVMLESFLIGGRQELNLGHSSDLTYGQSVTDACIDWETTESILEDLARAARLRAELTPAVGDGSRVHR